MKVVTRSPSPACACDQHHACACAYLEKTLQLVLPLMLSFTALQCTVSPTTSRKLRRLLCKTEYLASGQLATVHEHRCMCPQQTAPSLAHQHDCTSCTANGCLAPSQQPHPAKAMGTALPLDKEKSKHGGSSSPQASAWQIWYWDRIQQRC